MPALGHVDGFCFPERCIVISEALPEHPCRQVLGAAILVALKRPGIVSSSANRNPAANSNIILRAFIFTKRATNLHDVKNTLKHNTRALTQRRNSKKWFPDLKLFAI